jgi:hypothetical protein
VFGINSIDYVVRHLVGVAENVASVEAEDVGEIVDARNVAISDARLDDVLEFSSPDGAIEDA